MTDDHSRLAALRAELDDLDDQIHDLLLARGQLARRIAGSKGSGGIYRPQRQRDILARLLARHHGPLPPAFVARIWQEIFGTSLQVQDALRLAVFMPQPGAGYLELARDAFGFAVPTVAHRTPSRVIEAVHNGDASLGILPLPGRTDTAWWPSLMREAADTPRIIARLPLAGPWPGRADGVEGLVVAPAGACPEIPPTRLVGVETLDHCSRHWLRSLWPRRPGVEIVDAAPLGQDGEDVLMQMPAELATDEALNHVVRAGAPNVARVVALGGYAPPLSLS